MSAAAFMMLCLSVAQTASIQGVVRNKINNDAIESAKISVSNSTSTTTTDSLGNFTLLGLNPGFVIVTVEASGFYSQSSAEILITLDKTPFIELNLDPIINTSKNININVNQFIARKAESPVGAQNLSIREIERNPGGNRDISKIVQSLPGVITIPGFRNDIVIRGGAPSENKFYLDGIEIPVINHFQSQGGTGGPVGLLNVNLIKEVNLYTGAFPINYGNGTSGVFDFQQIQGNKEKIKFRGTVGSSDAGITLDGPLGKKKKTTFLLSVRQSYLQFLFSAIKLPFLPNYIDYQAKVNVKLNDKNELTFLTVGAVDFFRLNEKVNEGITDSNQLKSNNYILGAIPSFKQWNYAFGTVYTHYAAKSKNQLFFSRDMLRNGFEKYLNNDNSIAANKIKDYLSDETSYKFRFENSRKWLGWNLMAGAGTELSRYNTRYFDKSNPLFTINFTNDLQILKYSLFSRINKSIFNNGTLFSVGLRLDGNSFNAHMRNPLNQAAASISLSVPVAKNWYINSNIGSNNQLPAMTILGYKNTTGEAVNQSVAKYVRVSQAALGIQFNKNKETKITVEGFVKNYGNYPFSINKQISLANLGADFSVVGSEPVLFNGKGIAYGSEFLIQKRTKSGIYGIASYTLSWSKFNDKNDNLVFSAWDSRHTVSLTGGIKLKRNWEIGAKWRFVTGRPYTPDDIAGSMDKSYWMLSQQAKPNYALINSKRTAYFSQFDVRVDKVWYFKKSSLNIYMDIQNFLNQVQTLPSTLYVRKDANGNPITDPNNASAYLPDFIPNSNGFLQPAVGIIFDF